MRKLNIKKVESFVNENIATFHENKLKILKSIKLKKLLKKKNPYLFKAKNITVATDLIRNLLDAYLSSSEEKIFGDFLEDLAVFISGKTCGGRKSVATGIDMEFENTGTLYLVSVKSGPNWGNKSQQDKQEQDFKKAVKVYKQSKHTLAVEPILGICYGKTKTSYVRGAIKIVGQNFWYFISESEQLYIDIIEPLGYRAKQHNVKFTRLKGNIVNSFTKEFISDFCKKDGAIDWKKLVEFNSGNLDSVKKTNSKKKK